MSFGRFTGHRAVPAQRQPELLASINLTPFIDVLLVLLVVLMLGAPAVLGALGVRLAPPVVAGAVQPLAPAGADAQAIELAIDAQGRPILNGRLSTWPAVEAELVRLASVDAQRPVRLRADAALSYGDVAAAMGRLQAAGLTQLALLAQVAPSGPLASAPSP